MTIAFTYRLGGALAALFTLTMLTACDPTAFSQLHEGISTEADVTERLGQPQRVWPEADGARTLEYNRQPQGVHNYMITIGPDGKLRALRQVLTPETFALVRPGMLPDDVRRLLGAPATQITYRLKNETVWTWKYLEPPNETRAFHTVFDTQMHVLRTETGPSPDSPDTRGGR